MENVYLIRPKILETLYNLMLENYIYVGTGKLLQKRT